MHHNFCSLALVSTARLLWPRFWTEKQFVVINNFNLSFFCQTTTRAVSNTAIHGLFIPNLIDVSSILIKQMFSILFAVLVTATTYNNVYFTLSWFNICCLLQLPQRLSIFTLLYPNSTYVTSYIIHCHYTFKYVQQCCTVLLMNSNCKLF